MTLFFLPFFTFAGCVLLFPRQLNLFRVCRARKFSFFSLKEYKLITGIRASSNPT